MGALKILGENDAMRLLVIGGSEKNLDRLRSDLAKQFSDYSRFIFFVGMTSEVEKYLAAADAFLFPSYFEALAPSRWTRWSVWRLPSLNA